jgi:hypothetical protein
MPPELDQSNLAKSLEGSLLPSSFQSAMCIIQSELPKQMNGKQLALNAKWSFHIPGYALPTYQHSSVVLRVHPPHITTIFWIYFV